MRRKRKIQRVPQLDRMYGSPLIGKLINYVMEDGEKSVAEKIVYKALAQAAKKVGTEPAALFELALKNASPVLEVRPRRVGGATYQVPREVRGERRMQLAFRWIVTAARGHKTRRSMAEALAEELALAAQGQGMAIKKRDDMHKMAEANRAFAHFAW